MNTNIDELIEMQALSDANRTRVELLSQTFRAIEASHEPKMMRYARARDALDGHLPAISRKSNSISIQSLMRLYAAWKVEGWRALTVEYARKSAYVRLPEPFVQCWHEYFMRFQVDRSGAQARKALLARLAAWRAGDAGSAIPGYASPPPDQPGKDYPAGWSLRNLMKRKPSKLRTLLIKHGRSDAKAQCGPIVRRTRTDLEPGQLIIFDDVWQDHDVMFPGAKELVRPLGLVALDAASGKQIAWGMRPRLRGEGGKSVQLKAFDMEMLITDVLCHVGVHKDGCVFAMERGTANVSEKTERFLRDKFNVTVERGGVDRAASFFGGFVGAFKGNSRFKAALESHHNLIHNALSFIPAYTGKDRAYPENTQGMKLAYAALVRDAERIGMPRSAIDKLSVGALDWLTFIQIYDLVLQRVNARTDHALEGWTRRQIAEIRLSENAPWMPLDGRLSKAVVDELCAIEGLHRTRPMSPSEVWAEAERAQRIRRVNFSAFGEIFVRPDRDDRAKTLDARIVRRVSDRHEFLIAPNADSAEEFIFSSEITLPDGGKRILETGEEYKVLVNPFVGDELCVYALDGRYLGSSYTRRGRARYGDADALLPELGQASREFAKLAHPADALARARRREMQDAAANNRIVLADFDTRREREAITDEKAREKALEHDDLAISESFAALPAGDDSADDDFSEAHF